MRVSFTPTTGDYAAALAQVTKSQLEPRGRGRIAVTLLMLAISASLLLGMMVLLRSATGVKPPQRSHVQLGLSLVAGALFVGVPLVTWVSRRIRLEEQRLDTGDPLVSQAIEILPNGLHVETEAESSVRRWSSILKFVDTGHHLFIFLAPNSALFIPVTAFASAVEFRQFAKSLSAYVQQADA